MSDKLNALQAQLAAVQAEEAAERQKQAQKEQERRSAEREAKRATVQAEMDAVQYAQTNEEVDKILAAVGKLIKDPKTPIVVNYLMTHTPDPHQNKLLLDSYFRHANKQ